MRVPLLDLRRQYEQVGPAVEAAVRRVLESGQFILGEEVAALEREIAARHGVRHAIGMSSGRYTTLGTRRWRTVLGTSAIPRPQATKPIWARMLAPR